MTKQFTDKQILRIAQTVKQQLPVCQVVVDPDKRHLSIGKKDLWPLSIMINESDNEIYFVTHGAYLKPNLMRQIANCEAKLAIELL